jgi:hypothetical protein
MLSTRQLIFRRLNVKCFNNKLFYSSSKIRNDGNNLIKKSIFLSAIVVSSIAIGYSFSVSNHAQCADAKVNTKHDINIEAAKEAISDIIDAEEEKRGDGTSIAPTFVRLVNKIRHFNYLLRLKINILYFIYFH